MEIILVRHTSVGVPRGVCYGYSDIPVSEKFEEEANWLKSKLRNFNPDFICSSPLERCFQLAKHVYPNQEIIQFEEFKELNYGDWEMKTWDEINIPEGKDWIYRSPNLQSPNGESFLDLQRRVYSKFQEISLLEGERKIVFCHGGVIRALLSKILNLPLECSELLKIYYVAQVRLFYDEGKWKLIDLHAGYEFQ